MLIHETQVLHKRIVHMAVEKPLGVERLRSFAKRSILKFYTARIFSLRMTQRAIDAFRLWGA